MSNSYFRFKQFTVQQGNCGMKVSTDACIQGAWTPVLPHVKTVLDIGCGTGLLSLMLAQRNESIQIDAIELDEAAAVQARENVAGSPWNDRIKILQGDARYYPFDKKYDLIICNPPFFNNSLLGDNDARNQARHSLTLTQEHLFEIISNNLTVGGYSSVLLPVDENKKWEELLRSKEWHMHHYLAIKDNDNARIKRTVTCAAPEYAMGRNELFVIKNADGSYTNRFTELLSPFYLKL